MPGALRNFGAVRAFPARPAQHVRGTRFATARTRLRVTFRITLRVVLIAVLAVLLASSPLAQSGPARGATAEPAQQEDPEDALGRSTPRGAVLGFLSAARRGDYVLAREYLNTKLKSDAAEDLSRQLFVVLDARLPARLTQVSDAREGSNRNPLQPDVDVVGCMAGNAGPLIPIAVDRVRTAKTGPLWLFSAKALDAIPDLYAEIETARQERGIPQLLERRAARGR